MTHRFLASVALLVLVGCAADSPRTSSRGAAGASAANGASGNGSGNGTAGATGFGNSTSPAPTGTTTVVHAEDAGTPPADNCTYKDVDLVFTIDITGSMIPELNNIVAEVGKVDAALQAKMLPNPPHYGLVIFADDVMIMNSGEPYADVAALTSAVSAQIPMTNSVPWRQVDPANADTNFSWPENSLDALYAAATGFKWRPAATTLRTVIHVTDDAFWDLKAVSSAAGDPMMLEPAGRCSVSLLALNPNCMMTSSMHGYDDTIKALRDNSIWVNTFSAHTGGPPGATAPPASHGAFRGADVDVSFGFFTPYNGSQPIALSTGGDAWDVDDLYDGKISLATPIINAIVKAQCKTYPPPPPPPPPPE